MKKRTRNKKNKNVASSPKMWLQKNTYIVTWGGLIIALLSLIISYSVAKYKSNSNIFVEQFFEALGPLHIEECNEYGWMMRQEMLFAFKIVNTGDKRTTISQGRMTGFGDGNTLISPQVFYFDSDEDYLQTVESTVIKGASPFNFYDTNEVAYSIPLTIEPGITKNLVIRAEIFISVKSGREKDLFTYWEYEDDDWMLQYGLEYTDGYLMVPTSIRLIPVTIDFDTECPPASQ